MVPVAAPAGGWRRCWLSWAQRCLVLCPTVRGDPTPRGEAGPRAAAWDPLWWGLPRGRGGWGPILLVALSLSPGILP